MQSKIGHGISIAFAALIIFGLIGSLFKPESMLPVSVLVFTVLGWTAGRIVREGVDSSKALFAKPDVADEDKAE